ncbi:UNVERIFIED_CONTAM: hypothetical protein FKN15_050611 [Acipenser sinensis]
MGRTVPQGPPLSHSERGKANTPSSPPLRVIAMTDRSPLSSLCNVIQKRSLSQGDKVRSEDWDPVEIDIPVTPEKKGKGNKVSERDRDPGKGDNTQLKESDASKNKKSPAITQTPVIQDEWLRLKKNSSSESSLVIIAAEKT